MNDLSQRVNDLEEKFKKIANITKCLSEDEILHVNSELMHNSFNFLDKVASMPVDKSVVERLLNDKKLKPILREISRFRKIFNIRLELNRSGKILRSNKPWEVIKAFNFYKNYVELANMEVKGANLKSGQKVVFLGSGPLPLSLIILCKNYHLRGIGIEQHEEYVKISQEIINKLDIADRIKIIKGNHFSLSSDFKTDLIMIAAAAVPKDEIFNYLRVNMKSGTNISYRIYEQGLRKLLDVDNMTLFDNKEKQFSYLTDCKKIRPNPPVNNTCVFGKI